MEVFCLDASMNLAISDWTDHKIKIFLKEYTLLHTLGDYRDDVGGFHAPQGIALINNSKLIFLSYATHRLNLLNVARNVRRFALCGSEDI